jgi:hypothetical protein
MKEVDQVAYERERIGFLQRKVGDRPAHLKASLEYLRSTRKRQIIVFLDNIDQRSGEDQEQVFLISNELASTWPATVFVTLRPETFYKSSRTGALSGYQPRVFTISPPRCDIMLQRRVDFALRQIKETGRLGSYPAGVTADSASLAGFLEILSYNFRRNEPLLALIDNVAGGNMRMALKFVTDFVGSGHINTQKMLDVYENRGEYTIPVHEFLRALLYGDGQYYDPESSPIANLMNISYPDGREHFLLPLLLAYAQTAGERLRDEGYVAANDLFGFAQNLGFEPDQISSALDRATRGRLVDAAPKYSEQGHSLYYRITTVGAYTTRVLLAYFAYIDAIVVDTPIVEENYRNIITDAHSLADRVTRAEYFRLYLDRQWPKIKAADLPWMWPGNSAKLAEDIRKVGHIADPSTWA